MKFLTCNKSCVHTLDKAGREKRKQGWCHITTNVVISTIREKICVVVKIVIYFCAFFLVDKKTGSSRQNNGQSSFNKCMRDPITDAVRSWGLPQPPPFQAPALFLLHEANRN